MKLTTYTDYALRVLMYLAASRDRLATVREIADFHGIAKNHLTKVVHQLGMLDIIESVRGRNGGLRIKKEPKAINIGHVIRSTESRHFMAECDERGRNEGAAIAAGVLNAVLHEATDAYLDVLDHVTLADLLQTSGSAAASASFHSIRIRSRSKPPE